MSEITADRKTDSRIKYSIREPAQRQALLQGLKAGIPIGLGYFAVSFSLGIMARNAGLNWLAGVISSLLCNASAGQYAGYAVIAAGGTLIEMALLSLVANCRYLLMSSAMSQRVDPGISFGHRIFMGLYVTDEIFGVSMARQGYLNPWFTYGCAIVASPLWALGTALGCVAGNILPMRVVSALSVALFGMFLAIIIPPCKKEKKIIGIILVCFILSSAATYLPVISGLSEGVRTIILTVIIASGAAIIFPRDDEDSENREKGKT